MEQAVIREVGLRDGLQLAKTFVPTERKLAWCRREAAAGVREFEITSFVPPQVVPQFRDAAELAGAVREIAVEASALVPNLKGAQRAIASGVGKVNFVLSASEEHNLANVRRPTADSLADFRQIAAENRAAGGPARIAGGVATAFGCTIQGAVPEKRVLEIVEGLVDAGADELIVADTVGYAHPAQVARLFRAVLARTGTRPVYAHFHDTRGLGLANVVAAFEAGVRRFDASLGGLGGCPFAPGATGNIATEDCAFLLEQQGVRTGIDIAALLELRREVEGWLPGEAFAGSVARAGLPRTYHPAAA